MIIQCPNCGKPIVVNGLGRKPLNIPLKIVCEALQTHHSVAAAAQELGIASATAAAAAAAGVDVSEHMPTLETMQGPGFDADAHNRAMQEISNK